MNYKIKGEELTEILDDIKDIDKLLTERIVDLAPTEARRYILGGSQARHAYIYYRSLLWEVRDKILAARETK